MYIYFSIAPTLNQISMSMETQSILWAEGSDIVGGDNHISSISPDGSNFTQIITSDRGARAIRGVTFDWIAGKSRTLLLNH